MTSQDHFQQATIRPHTFAVFRISVKVSTSENRMQIKGFLFSEDYLSEIRANDAEMSVLGFKTLRRNKQQFNAERIYFNKILLNKKLLKDTFRK